MTKVTLAARAAAVHPAWWVAATAFVALLGAAGFRAASGVLMVPLQADTAGPARSCPARPG